MKFLAGSVLLFIVRLFLIAIITFPVAATCNELSDVKEIRNFQIGKILSYTSNKEELNLLCQIKNSDDTARIQINFPFIDAVRVQIKLFGSEPGTANGASYKIIDKQNSIIISTDSLSVCIRKDQWRLTVLKGTRKIFAERSELSDSNNIKEICLINEMFDDEHFFGFGEKFNGIDQRSYKVVMELDDAYKSMDNKTYKSIPFFLSSRRYGILVNSPKRIIFHMGDLSTKEYSFENPDSSIEYFIFTNSDPLEIISQYTSITGRSRLVPKWSLEPWLSRRQMTGWNNPANAEKDVDMMIKDGFRLGVILWEGVSKLYSSNRYVSQMNKLSDKWHEIGIKQVCWGHTGHIPENKIDWSHVDKNYFLRASDGSFEMGARGRNHVYIDPTNPKAMQWYKNTIYKYRFRSKNGKSTPTAWNLDGIKLDFSELFPKNDSNILGIDKSIGMHNQHAVLFSRQIYDWLQKIRPDGGITWVRGGGIGLQTVGFVWGGDRGRTFEQMRGTIAASLAVSICGVSLTGHDLGGYRGDDSPEARKVYIRGVQYATFSPAFQDHGSAPAPWEQDKYGIDNYSFYSRVRYNLIPYLYHYVKVSHSTGVPIMRTLYLQNPEDDKTYNIEDEYYLGEQMLVTPIITGLDKREIYLPKGNWIDFWNKTHFSGGQKINYDVSLNRIPVFVKAGTILPLALNDSLQIGGLFPMAKKDSLLLTFRLFEGPDSELKFFGNDTIIINKSKIKDDLIVNVDNIKNNFALIIDGLQPETIVVNKENLDRLTVDNFAESKAGWYFNDKNNQTFIKIKSQSGEKKYRINLRNIKKIIAEKSDSIKLKIPEIIQAVGWDKSANIFFKPVKNAESYIIKYWSNQDDHKTEIRDITSNPVTISNLDNGKEYNITISAVCEKQVSQESAATSVYPSKHIAFFKVDDKNGFINAEHFLKKKEVDDSTEKYTYGLMSARKNHYIVWLKVKRNEEHHLYFRWYTIGKVDLTKGKNYFSLALTKNFSIDKLYFTINKNNRPAFKDEIEASFEEGNIQINNEKLIIYR